jgi:hypothetical protein
MKTKKCHKNKGGMSKNEGKVSKMCVSPREKITPSIEPRNGDIQKPK